ncbi:MAG: hypothetical protein M3P40_13165 [Actinomycetota bacterium]|nr:hypothetical protein [Actinomycetota bacterium]
MTSLLPPSVPVSQLGRAAHDIGMAGLLGGTLFGRLALHPSVTEITDATERGKVINTAWRRYGLINSLSLAAVVGAWLPARLDETSARNLSERELRLARAKDVMVGAVAVTGLASMVEGIRFSRSAPGGAVPLHDGDHVTASATPEQQRRKRRVNALGIASLAADIGLAATNAALAQESFRRPPARRLVSRLRK